MNKYEKLIEYIINEQEDQARDLFHQIVVEKSREIYENLIDEEGIEEEDVAMDSLVDEVDAEQEGVIEADDEDDMDDMEMDAEMPGDDMGGEEGEGELEDRVMDLEAALDELKAEFDALMNDEMNEPEHADMEMPADMEPPKESMVREYVDKVATPSNAEGKTVGAQSSSKPTVNTKSPNGPGANMGGHANLAKGGAEQAPDGKPTPQPNNQYAKGKGNLPHAGQFENVPGAKTKGYAAKASAKSAEGSTTDGSLSVAKNSPVLR